MSFANKYLSVIKLKHGSLKSQANKQEIVDEWEKRLANSVVNAVQTMQMTMQTASSRSSTKVAGLMLYTQIIDMHFLSKSIINFHLILVYIPRENLESY